MRLTGTLRVAEAINHLYVGLPVLDDGKHYWVSNDEIDKLLRAGEGWLADHPDRELITRRYLAHKGSLARQAIARLAEVDDTDPDALDDAAAAGRPDAGPAGHDRADAAGADDEVPDSPVPLVVQRHGAVLAALRSVRRASGRRPGLRLRRAAADAARRAGPHRGRRRRRQPPGAAGGSPPAAAGPDARAPA